MRRISGNEAPCWGHQMPTIMMLQLPRMHVATVVLVHCSESGQQYSL